METHRKATERHMPLCYQLTCHATTQMNVPRGRLTPAKQAETQFSSVQYDSLCSLNSNSK